MINFYLVVGRIHFWVRARSFFSVMSLRPRPQASIPGPAPLWGSSSTSVTSTCPCISRPPPTGPRLVRAGTHCTTTQCLSNPPSTWTCSLLRPAVLLLPVCGMQAWPPSQGAVTMWDPPPSPAPSLPLLSRSFLCVVTFAASTMVQALWFISSH